MRPWTSVAGCESGNRTENSADDRTARERIEIRHRGRLVAAAVGAQNDADLYLFVTRARLALKKEDPVELRATTLTPETKISEPSPVK